jgi:endonuclease III
VDILRGKTRLHHALIAHGASGCREPECRCRRVPTPERRR